MEKIVYYITRKKNFSLFGPYCERLSYKIEKCTKWQNNAEVENEFESWKGALKKRYSQKKWTNFRLFHRLVLWLKVIGPVTIFQKPFCQLFQRISNQLQILRFLSTRLKLLNMFVGKLVQIWKQTRTERISTNRWLL